MKRFSSPIGYLLVPVGFVLLLPVFLVLIVALYLVSAFQGLRILVKVVLGKNDEPEHELPRPHFLEVQARIDASPPRT